MTVFNNILLSAHEKALHVLREYGIFTLNNVPVKVDFFSSCSYCLGYDPDDSIAVHVNGMRLTEALVSRASREALTEFLVHELGHAFLFKLWNTSLTKEEQAEFIRLFGDYHSDGDGYQHRVQDTVRATLGLKPREFDKARFASLYAVTSPHEDWAETFAYLVMDKPTPKEKREYVMGLLEKYGR